jgi:hypothetical protein
MCQSVGWVTETLVRVYKRVQLTVIQYIANEPAPGCASLRTTKVGKWRSSTIEKRYLGLLIFTAGLK